MFVGRFQHVTIPVFRKEKPKQRVYYRKSNGKKRKT